MYIYFVCKSCGRAMKTETKPNFCYADRSSNMENISDEDAVKMELFLFSEGKEIDGIIYEFPGDIKYHPFTGGKLSSEGKTLSDFQDEIMRRVVNG